MLLVQLLIVALAGCNPAAASASLSVSGAALIQPSAVVIRQFALLSSAQQPAIGVNACSELWAAESVSQLDAAQLIRPALRLRLLRCAR